MPYRTLWWVELCVVDATTGHVSPPTSDSRDNDIRWDNQVDGHIDQVALVQDFSLGSGSWKTYNFTKIYINNFIFKFIL